VALREIVLAPKGKKPKSFPRLREKSGDRLKRFSDVKTSAKLPSGFRWQHQSQGGFLGIYRTRRTFQELEDKSSR